MGGAGHDMPRRKTQAAYGDISTRRMDYHEAGHAVADFHANFVVDSVTIEPHGEYLATKREADS
jgi:hypothetical protein